MSVVSCVARVRSDSWTVASIREPPRTPCLEKLGGGSVGVHEAQSKRSESIVRDSLASRRPPSELVNETNPERPSNDAYGVAVNARGIAAVHGYLRHER
jgi:hypothetical protein